MKPLTLDVKFTAEILGLEPEDLRMLVEKEHLQGVLKIDQQWRMSVFTIAKLLNTTPEQLLEFLEDFLFGELMDEVEGDEFLSEEEARKVYQSALAGA